MELFSGTDYKEALKKRVAELKAQGTKITFESLAEACRVQKTYLSKVLNHDGDLSEDQLELAGDFLKWNAEEKDYISLLRSYALTQLPERRRSLRKKIEAIQKERLQTTNQIHVLANELNAEQMQNYYLDPLLQVLHIFLTVEKFAKNPELIATKLNLPIALVVEKMAALERMQIIRREKGSIKVVKDNLHLPPGSGLFGAYRNLLRAAAQERMGRLPKENAYSFSVIFSASENVRQQIQQLFLEYLQQVQKLVQKSREEEVYQMNFDLFPWS